MLLSLRRSIRRWRGWSLSLRRPLLRRVQAGSGAGSTIWRWRGCSWRLLWGASTRRGSGTRVATEHICFLIDVHLGRLLHLTCRMRWLRSAKTGHWRLLVGRRRRASFRSICINVGQRCRCPSWELRSNRGCAWWLRCGQTGELVCRHT